MCARPDDHSRGGKGMNSSIQYSQALASGDVDVQGNHFSADTRTLLAALNLCNINYRFTKKEVEVLNPISQDAYTGEGQLGDFPS